LNDNDNTEVDTFIKNKPKIALIFTGGTIGAAKDFKKQYIDIKNDGEELFHLLLSQKKEIKSKYEFYYKDSNPFIRLSENIIPFDWAVIAEKIASRVNQGVDGVVVTHGTDTMPYTASAISFMLSEVLLPVPIVFTGSIIPFTEKDTDAIQNLYDSIVFAAKSPLSGVFVVFHGNVFLGNRLQSIRPHGKKFYSADDKIMATIRNDDFYELIEGKSHKRSALSKRVTPKTNIESKVTYLKVYPGFDPWYIEKAIEHRTKGVILELFHSGTASTDTTESKYSLIPAIKMCVENSILIFGVPSYNSSESIYITTKQLEKAGLILLDGISPEAAIVKLMWLLGTYPTVENEVIKKKMRDENIAGENFG